MAASGARTDPEEGLHPGLTGTQHQVGEPLGLGGCHRPERVDHIAQRVSRHQGQTLVEQLEGGAGIGGHPGASRVGQPREAPGVEGALGQLEDVPGCTTRHPDRRGLDPVTAGGVAESAAQAGHAHLQRRQRGLGRRVPPQLGEQPVDGHDPPGVGRQQPEQPTLQRRGDAARAPVDRG